MSKLKKWIMTLSISCAVICLTFTISLLHTSYAYAAESNQSETSYGASENAPNASDQVTGEGGAFNTNNI